MATVHISEDTLIEAMKSEQTRKALAGIANRIAQNAQARLGANKAGDEVSRSSGNRPSHDRPYERVELDGKTSPLHRRQILEQSL